MADPRTGEYAELLVGRCIDPRPGWQVLVTGTVQARPLMAELSRALARRGCWPLRRLTWGPSLGLDLDWLAEAPEELAREVAPLELDVLERVDAAIFVVAPEDARQLAGHSPAALNAQTSPYRRRGRAGEIPTVLCDYPCQAFADESGLSLPELEDVMFGACLRDWDAEAARMEPLRARLERARVVRIVGEDTDLTLDVEDRPALTDDGRLNMPGGEVYCCPVSADGRIRFSHFPQLAYGEEVWDIRLVFRDGEVVEATAGEGEDVLLRALDTDDGSRRVGELGIGCNPGVRRHMKNLLFDEKMDGTVHVAVGAGLPIAGGTNVSALHWDLVRSMRGSRLMLDGEVVQEDGAWRL
ncbi:MAG: aminopeptidase [Gaiellaceae bacterium]